MHLVGGNFHFVSDPRLSLYLSLYNFFTTNLASAATATAPVTAGGSGSEFATDIGAVRGQTGVAMVVRQRRCSVSTGD
jgi:hypothetical protein